MIDSVFFAFGDGSDAGLDFDYEFQAVLSITSIEGCNGTLTHNSAQS
jgi:hypothetical protein